MSDPKKDPYQERRAKEKERVWLDSMIQSDMLHDFYGTITVKLEKGHIRHIAREQTILPPKE